MMLKSMRFPLTVRNRTSNLGKICLYSHLSFTAAYSLKSVKDWPVFILLNCEAASLTVFTTMCPKEQQTSDNLIVKDNCFIIKYLIIALVVFLGDV